MLISALLVLVMITALTALAQSAAAAVNISGDAQTLLNERAWADTFHWNSSSIMCQDWPGVECYGTDHVVEL